jgi:creatinine amidohydrolase
LYGDEVDPSGHGGEPLSSVMLYLYPEDMRMDLLSKTERNKQWEGFPIKGLAKVGLHDGEASVYLNMEDISSEGIMGNPFAASADRGEAIINKILEYAELLIEKLKKAKTTL